MGRFYTTPIFCYAAGFVFPYCLTFLPFVKTVGNYSDKTHTFILSSIAAFLLGLLIANYLPVKKKFQAVVPSENIEFRGPVALKILLIWYVIALLCISYEFYKIGGFPLFMKDVEVIRFRLQVNGYIHMIGISLGFVSSILALYARFAWNSKLRWQMRILAWGGFAYLLMSGNRADCGFFLVLYAIASLFVSKRGFKWYYSIIFLLFMAAFVGLNLYRQTTYNPTFVLQYLYLLRTEPATYFYTILPLYMTLTFNFSILDALINSGAGGFTGGTYTFYAFLWSSLVSNKPVDFGVFKNEWLQISFYSELTSTYLSNFYVDFGFWGGVIGSLLLGAFIQSIYRFAMYDRRYIFLYAVVFLQFALFFYVFFYYYFLSILEVVLAYIVCRYGLAFAKERSPRLSPDHCQSHGVG